MPGADDVSSADVFGLATGDVRTGPYLLLLAVASSAGSYAGTARRLTPAQFSGGIIMENRVEPVLTLPDSSQFRGQTGFSNYCFSVGAGVHTWTFFVADSHTDGGASAMLIDNFSVTPLPPGPDTVVPVADINPGWRGSYPCFMTVFRNQLYFRANQGLNDTELWRFDGVGAARVGDLNPGPAGSSPANLAVLDDTLYFNASTAAGYRVWRYDGTEAARITNANPPYAFFEAAFWKPVVWYGELCYPSQGKLHFFNGSRFATLNAPPWLQMDLVLWNNALYYGAQEMSCGVELWRYNGVTQTRVSDINPGPADANPEALYVFGNSIYFRARSAGSGNELYRYDGTSAARVADMNPGPADSNPAEFCGYRGHVYFSADDGVHGYELWRTDGTNVTLVADINTNPVYESGGDRYSDSWPHRLTVWRDKLYFAASRQWESGLWSYDGTTVALVGGGTANADGSLGGVSELVVFNDRLYFDADDGVNGRELWCVVSDPERRLSIARDDQTVQLRLSEATTGDYVIQASSDLQNWTPIATNRAVDGSVTFTDPAAAQLPRRIYRAVAVP